MEIREMTVRECLADEAVREALYRNEIGRAHV